MINTYCRKYHTGFFRFWVNLWVNEIGTSSNFALHNKEIRHLSGYPSRPAITASATCLFVIPLSIANLSSAR